jgi:hypothetical protein
MTAPQQNNFPDVTIAGNSHYVDWVRIQATLIHGDVEKNIAAGGNCCGRDLVQDLVVRTLGPLKRMIAL